MFHFCLLGLFVYLIDFILRGEHFRLTGKLSTKYRVPFPLSTPPPVPPASSMINFLS